MMEKIICIYTFVLFSKKKKIPPEMKMRIPPNLMIYLSGWNN